MSVFPCCEKSLCLDPASPIENLSAEGGDGPSFLGYSFPWVDQNNPVDGTPDDPFGPVPPIPPFYAAAGCASVCISSLSQEDADLCAARQAFICTHPNNDLFYNSLQVCNFTCPDGTVYSYRIYAGSFVNTTQAAADEQAAAVACRFAGLTNMCLSNISGGCINEPYSQSITVNGPGLPPFQFAIISGGFPPGISALQTTARTLVLSGTPTATGNTSFRVRVTDARGDFMEKDYTISIMGLTNSPPQGHKGTAYSFQYLVAGGTAPYTFVIDAGSLPDGLAMDSSGLISGTPTAVQTSTFTVSFSDSSP